MGCDTWVCGQYQQLNTSVKSVAFLGPSINLSKRAIGNLLLTRRYPNHTFPVSLHLRIASAAPVDSSKRRCGK
jgi:hypothetical protein